MKFREFLETDLKEWDRIAKSEFLPEDFTSSAHIKKYNAKGWILLDDNDQWIGCCFNMVWDEKNKGGIHFLEICVFPKYRGKGYAKYLVKLLFDNAIGYRI